MTAALYPVAEVQGLYRTIYELRQRIADLESAQTLGAADRVILRAMEGREMTAGQIGVATGMVQRYAAQRVYRLAAMGKVEKCGEAKRQGGGSGKNQVLWRIKA